MRKKAVIICITIIFSMLIGCGQPAATAQTETAPAETVAEEIAEPEKVAEPEIDTDAEEEKLKAEEEAKAQQEAEAENLYEEGRKYLYGLDGTEVSFKDAYDNFVKAEELGKDDATFYIGVLYDWFSYPERDFVKAREYYEKCENNPYAKIALGFLYLNAQGVDEDMNKAADLFQSAVDEGVADGYCGLASIAYSNEEYEKRLEYLNIAVDEGTEQMFVADAMGALGGCYYNGQGVKKDMNSAVEWTEKAVELNNPSAMDNLAQFYLRGEGVEQNNEKAIELFEKAVELNNRLSMYNLGYIYYSGMAGVERDIEKSLKYNEMAYNLGDGNAAYGIAYMYANGDGVEKDKKTALEWYEKAMELGVEVSEAELNAVKE